MELHGIKRRDVIRLDTDDRTYFTAEGYLVDHPIVTRIGIFEYRARDGTIRKEFRPPEEVFAPESLESYVGKPVIITHDAGMVDTGNVADEEIGTILEAGYRDGDNVRAKIVIHDVDAMKDSGLKELSLGYSLDLDETPGEYNGEQYDAVQRNIRINHLALVSEARAGNSARLNVDGTNNSTISQEGETDMRKRKDADDVIEEKITPETGATEPENTEEDIQKEAAALAGDTEEAEEPKASPIDEIRAKVDARKDAEAPETLEAAEEIIAEQEAELAQLLDFIDAEAAVKDMDAACNKADDEEPAEEPKPEEAEDDEEAEESEPEAPAEDEPTLNEDSVDRKVTEIISILRVGDKLHMDGLEKLRNSLEMKKAIIRKVNPKMNFDGKSKMYINAAYDYAVANLDSIEKHADYQRRQMFGGAAVNHDAADKDAGLTRAQAARKRMIEREGGNK